MSDFQIYHNPRCSKSRQTLALLQERGVEPEIILYLDNPPTEKQLKTVIKQLGVTPRELIRKGEADYKAMALADPSTDDNALIAAMCECPKLIERPIVITGGRAVLGRPPENVLELL